MKDFFNIVLKLEYVQETKTVRDGIQAIDDLLSIYITS